MPDVTLKLFFDAAARVKALRDRWRDGLSEFSAQVPSVCAA